MKPSKTAERALRLYYITDAALFECDFVLAHDARQARSIFRSMYGFDADDVGTVELVKTLDERPSWAAPMWLGPDNECLAELGGERIAGIHFPKWAFDGESYGSTQTADERYPYPKPEK